MKVSIRASVYRGKSGYTTADGRSSVFTESREDAEHIRNILRWQLPFAHHVWAMQAVLIGGAQ